MMKLRQIASAASLMMLASAAMASDKCTINVDSTDAMQFDTKAITVNKSCKEFTVNLAHTGKLPKQAMGHNWVLAKEADAHAVAADGIGAGLDKNYLKPGDVRIIAATKIIGGGEKTSVTFPVSKLSPSEKYTFFCSFPGHIGMMKGSLTLK